MLHWVPLHQNLHKEGVNQSFHIKILPNMKKPLVSIILTSSIFALTLLSCQKDLDEQPNAFFFTQAELEEIKLNTCLAVIPDDLDYHLDETLPTGILEERAAGMKNKFWAPGTTLRVRFLGGNATLQNKVMNYAKQWEQFASITFVKVSSGPAEIRVAFDNDGHWSYVGKDNLNIPANQKTMNLNFLVAGITETQIRATTLHEFGHALGLGHEHQNPLANIPWNVPAVYAFYTQMGWSQDKINHNVLNKYQWSQTQHTNHDTKSIMQYPVQASLTTNGLSIPMNNLLSATDKDFIGRIYSNQKIRVRHAVNATWTITFWLNGIYHTLQPGESMWVPAKTSGNQLSIWECPNGNCAWDNYTPVYGKNYRIVAQGNNGNLTLALD